MSVCKACAKEIAKAVLPTAVGPTIIYTVLASDNVGDLII
jgi:hypothetical protein